MTHTVTSDDGKWDSIELEGGSTGTVTAPSEPGDYSFHCEHPHVDEGLAHRRVALRIVDLSDPGEVAADRSCFLDRVDGRSASR